MSNVHLYQIAYSPESLAQIEPGYQVLNNLENPRPDWYEYWPIRKFLREETMDENSFYGFFSPKFRNKTNLSFLETEQFVKEKAATADIMIFSPQFDMGGFFINIFEQGETFDHGFKDAFQKFLNEVGWPVSLDQLVMDSSQIVFSNYFVAKPAFWREWHEIANALFMIAEDQSHPLSAALRFKTTYPGQVERKVFMQERLASLLLSTNKQRRVAIKNPLTMAWSALPTNQFVREAVISDALKRSYNMTGFPEYLAVFDHIRKSVFHS
jgi:hypothetical protein